MALYFFDFEMGYVAHKLESNDMMEYKWKKKYLTIVKAIIMINLLLIQILIATLTLISNTVYVLKDIKAHNLEMIIIVRISVLLCDGYMFT